jgi:multidrug efflux pump subunit AcrB
LSNDKQHPGLHHGGFISKVTEIFVDSKISPLIIIFSLLLGLFAILQTPSEEEPQIVVPMIDVFVQMPGATPKEIENRVVSPMEKLIWEVPGVEYLYSTAMPGRALTVVRFYVGEDVEKSLVKVYDKLYSHLDWIPPGCSKPILKPKSIDDVPFLVLTFWGERYDGYTLRKLVAGVDDEVRSIFGVSETSIKGGLQRVVRVDLLPDKLANLGLDPLDVAQAVLGQNQAGYVGGYDRGNKRLLVRLNNFFTSK